LKLDLFPIDFHCLDFEINANCGQVRRGEVTLRELEEDARLAYA
jgi:hypothetical protein